jgi:predicted ATP-grasp superfamily ATP-dependent carboligase
MLFNSGKIRAKFTHRRLRERRLTGGMSTLRTGVVNPAIEEHAQRLLESVRFHGVAMVEFKFDEQTKKGWLLEVNPRFWGSLALAIQSGVDFPYLLYIIATEGDVLPVMEYRPGVTVRWLLGDLQAKVQQLRCPRSRSSILRMDVRANGYDDLYWDDPLPFLSEGILSAWKHFKTAGSEAEQTDISLDRLEAS